MRLKRVLAILVAGAGSLTAQYQWDLDQNPPTSAYWQRNGSGILFGSWTTFLDTGGDSLIYNQTVSGSNPNDYDLDVYYTLTSGGGGYIQYVRASPDAYMGESGSNETCTGNFVAIEFDPPTSGFNNYGTLVPLNIYQCASGTLTYLGAPSVSISNGMTMRTVAFGNTLWIFVNNRMVDSIGLPSGLTGNPGIGGYSQSSANGVTWVRIGHHDTVSPNAVNNQTIGVSALPNQISMQWAGAVDDSPGIGLWQYEIYRGDANGNNAAFLGETPEPEYSDDTAQPGVTYTYWIYSQDWHGNSGLGNPFQVSAPPAQAVDPRRIGVRPLGSYWGGAGEQIDLASMNLNFTIPLLSAKGRGNWSVPFNLTYNSQNWRQDTGGTWKLGYDVGYGFGWQLLAGSLMPYYAGWSYSVDHYVFTDATGAQYRLTNNGGLWNSTEGIYIWFDANAGILYFPDGSFWQLGCISGGTEADAGTLYPTQMEDANGNLVKITYAAGSGEGFTLNTSARIGQIEDVRGNGGATYAFFYNSDSTPHLEYILNNISSGESYQFGITSFALSSPFSPYPSYGQSYSLGVLINTATSTARQFWYSAAGELQQAETEDGGSFSWTYGSYTYSNGRTYREVNHRSLQTGQAGAGLVNSFAHDDSGNPNATVHATTMTIDSTGTEKVWTFYTPNSQPAAPGAWAVGLVSEFRTYYLNGSPGARDVSYTWTTNASNTPYISQIDTILDDGTPHAAHMRQTQVLDQYGNVTSASTYDYSSLTTPIQTSTNTFLHAQNSNYDNAYLRNLLVSSSVTDNNGHSATMVTNTYDGAAPAAVSGGTPQEWDASRGTSFTIRGNLTQSVSLGLTTTYTYDVTGHQLTGANTSGTGASATYSSATNWAAPDVLTPAAGTGDVQNGHTVTQASGSSLQNGYGYNSALSLVSTTMPNSATTGQNFDATTGLLDSSTSVYGAQTTYTYVFNPTMVTATTNSHWSKSYRDGFGRETAHETGYGSTVVSHADTVYGACACSPLGKVVQVSQPYGINGAMKITSDGTGNVAWTVYTYDSLGRTVSVTAADGSVTQYSYAGNTTTITDPAGHWKTYTNNALGQLVTVTEPNPVYPSSNYVTSYSYDVEGHLTQVYMQRPTSGAGMQTQTRTFQYDLPTGHLLSAANPENGTVSYAYYPDGLLKSKTDASGQQVVYSYDGYGRISYIDRYPAGSQTADICQSLTLGYDDSSVNSMGRLRSINWGPPYTIPSSSSCGTMSMGESYNYNAAGQLTYKGYSANFQYCFSCDPPAYGWYALGENYTYDSEGTLTSYWDGYFQYSQFPEYTFNYTYTLDAMERPIALTEQDWVSNTNPPSGPPNSTKTWV